MDSLVKEVFIVKIYEWKEGLSPEECKNGAYWERNMLALLLAVYMNKVVREQIGEIAPEYYPCGWYYDTDNNFKGFKRVISINNGIITFHIPDDFDTGNLPQIEPNWNGHTTKEKWENVMNICGCKIESEG